MRSFLLAALPVLFSVSLSAQLKLEATVVDKESRQAISNATVHLIRLPDSSIIRSDLTNELGRFLLVGITAGDYLLRITYVSYQQENIPVSLGRNQDLGQIGLIAASSQLSEVTVTSKPFMLSASIDRKVYMVSQDLTAVSGSVSDVLRNVPSIEMDMDGGIQLRGSGSVLIMINGRPSPLMGSNSGAVLEQIPASLIERIEVITNPSAKYRPDGTSGIINIVLKKNVKLGWNGSLTGSVGNRDRYNGSFQVNYKPGRWNYSLSYGLRKDSRSRWGTKERTLSDRNGKTSAFSEQTTTRQRPMSHFLSAGIQYDMNERNKFGISGNLFNRKLVRTSVSHRRLSEDGSDEMVFDRELYGPEKEKEKEMTFFWEHGFGREDEELQLEINLASDPETEDNTFTNRYFFPMDSISRDRTGAVDYENQQQVSLDYTRPAGDDGKIETGYAGYFIQQDFERINEYFANPEGRFIRDQLRSNRFRYRDWNHAFYATWQKEYERFGYMIGLRAEQVKLKGFLVTKDSAIRNQYFRTFPTVHISWKVKTGALQLNYSKRINRPEGDELNPFFDYTDPLNISAGNSQLLPELIHSVELGYKWQRDKLSFFPGIYYRHKNNGFTSVSIPLNDSVLLNTEQNLSKERSGGLELIFSLQGKFYTVNGNANLFYTSIDASQAEYFENRSIISMASGVNGSFSITSSTQMQVSANYRSARLTLQGRQYASFVANLGIRQDLLQKKLSLSLTVSDFLRTQRQKSILESNGLFQVSRARRDAQVIFLSLNYRFGLSTKKQEEKLQFDDAL